MARRKRLGEILIEGKRINETQLAAALHSQRTWGGRLGSTLVRMGFVSEEQILQCLSAQLRLPSVDFGKVKVSHRALQTVPLRIAEKYNVIPVAVKEEAGKKTVILAMSDPTNLDAINEIQFQTGVAVRPVVATESAVARTIDRYYRKRGMNDGYGYEKLVDLSAAADEMVILPRGEEERTPRIGDRDPLQVLRALIQVLEEKGLIKTEEILRALRRGS